MATPPAAEPNDIARSIRLAALAGSVGAALGFVGDLYHIYWGFFTDLDRSDLLDDPLYRAHGMMIAVGYALALLVLPALAVRHRTRLRSVARVGVLLAFVGTTLVAGDYWAESVVTPGVVADQPTLADADATGMHLAFVVAAFGLLAIGWLLVSIGAWRVLPRPASVALAVGAVVAFTPFSGSNLLLFTAIGAVAWRLRAP